MGRYATYPSLEGRSVFITGGASGIGEDMVHQFVSQGAKVAFLDIETELGEALVERCAREEPPHVPVFMDCDVTDVEALQAAVERAATLFGGLHTLVNNAASDDRHYWDEVSPAYWDDRLAVNLRHHFFAIQAAVPHMREGGAGSIINIGSSSWMIGEDYFPAYATAKAAVQGLTSTLARTFGVDNIRVNTVLPGWIFTDRQLEKWVTPESEAACMAMQCLKKRIYPDEYNQTILFLAADDSGACTAQAFVVDGGRRGL